MLRFLSMTCYAHCPYLPITIRYCLFPKPSRFLDSARNDNARHYLLFTIYYSLFTIYYLLFAIP